MMGCVAASTSVVAGIHLKDLFLMMNPTERCLAHAQCKQIDMLFQFCKKPIPPATLMCRRWFTRRSPISIFSNGSPAKFEYGTISDVIGLCRLRSKIIVSILFQEESSKALLSLVPSISDGSPSVSERDFWLSRILELENNLRTQQSEFARKRE